jgi:hypothetical protein
LTPFVVLLFLVTVIGIPAGLGLLALYLLALYLSQAVVGLALGRQLLTLARRHAASSRGSLILALGLGLLILAALHALPVPVLGVVITIFTVLFGLGALWLGMARLHRQVNQTA